MQLNNQPLVSIIMPMHNSEATIARAMDSVLSQTYNNWELLIVDDASQDQSVMIASRLGSNDSRISIEELKTQNGAGIARNIAIENANGQYTAFLDSDDEWLPKKLEKQIYWMMKKNIKFSCTAYFREKNSGERDFRDVPRKANRSALLKNNTVGTLTAMYDVSQLGKCYMSEIKRRQDYGLWLDLLDKTENVYGLQEPLAVYHAGQGTLSSNKLKAAISQWRFFRDQQELSFPKAVYYFAHYALNAGLRNI